MSFQPSPKQALFLWKMITAPTPEERVAKWSDAGKRLNGTSRQEREELVERGFLEIEKRGNARVVQLADRAWGWAASAANVELLKSRSTDGAIALERLLRRLIPLLERHGIALAELFGDGEQGAAARPNGAEATSTVSAADPAAQTPSAVTSQHDADALEERIVAACLALTQGDPRRDVRLAALRRALSSVSADVLDAGLLRLHESNRIALYRDDNTAALAHDDELAALWVGDAPRHLLYLKSQP